MTIAITGASGFIGRGLAAQLRREGHTVRAISMRGDLNRDSFVGCDAVVHLAGEPVAQRWTTAARRRIIDSRVNGTRAVVAAMTHLEHKPAVLVSASAVGYYGSRGAEILTESSPPSSDFLSEVAVAWEGEARAAEKLGVRVVTLRIGVVLGPAGGALARMLLPFRLGLGGRLGNGQQWMSWIHLEDLLALIQFALRTPRLSGAVNAVAPHPATNAEFTRALAHALHRPAIFPVPPFALKLLFGEMAEILLGGQRVLPEAAQREGFQFRYFDLAAALEDALGSHKTSGTPNA